MEVIHSPCQRWKTLCFLYRLCLGGRWWRGGGGDFAVGVSHICRFSGQTWLYLCRKEAIDTLYCIHMNMRDLFAEDTEMVFVCLTVVIQRGRNTHVMSLCTVLVPYLSVSILCNRQIRLFSTNVMYDFTQTTH